MTKKVSHFGKIGAGLLSVVRLIVCVAPHDVQIFVVRIATNEFVKVSDRAGVFFLLMRSVSLVRNLLIAFYHRIGVNARAYRYHFFHHKRRFVSMLQELIALKREGERDEYYYVIFSEFIS